jgi:acetoin utilization deacetylase AcuC-like enzyme
MSLILVHTERFAEHQTPPGHPERPERADVLDAIAARWRERGADVVAPREASQEQLRRVHDADYVRRLSETSGRGGGGGPAPPTTPPPTHKSLLPPPPPPDSRKL